MTNQGRVPNIEYAHDMALVEAAHREAADLFRSLGQMGMAENMLASTQAEIDRVVLEIQTRDEVTHIFEHSYESEHDPKTYLRRIQGGTDSSRRAHSRILDSHTGFTRANELIANNPEPFMTLVRMRTPSYSIAEVLDIIAHEPRYGHPIRNREGDFVVKMLQECLYNYLEALPGYSRLISNTTVPSIDEVSDVYRNSVELAFYEEWAAYAQLILTSNTEDEFLGTTKKKSLLFNSLDDLRQEMDRETMHYLSSSSFAALRIAISMNDAGWRQEASLFPHPLWPKLSRILMKRQHIYPT